MFQDAQRVTGKTKEEMHAIGLAISLVLTALSFIAILSFSSPSPQPQRLAPWFPYEIAGFFRLNLAGLFSTFACFSGHLLVSKTADLDEQSRMMCLLIVPVQFCLGLFSLWYTSGASCTCFTKSYIVLGIATALLSLAWWFPVAYLIALHSFI